MLCPGARGSAIRRRGPAQWMPPGRFERLPLRAHPLGHVLDYVMQDHMIGQYRQQGICAIIAIIGIDQQICHPNGPHMRHLFDDKRSLVPQGVHSQNTHKITFQKPKICAFLNKLQSQSAYFVSAPAVPPCVGGSL